MDVGSFVRMSEKPGLISSTDLHRQPAGACGLVVKVSTDSHMLVH